MIKIKKHKKTKKIDFFKFLLGVENGFSGAPPPGKNGLENPFLWDQFP